MVRVNLPTLVFEGLWLKEFQPLEIARLGQRPNIDKWFWDRFDIWLYNTYAGKFIPEYNCDGYEFEFDTIESPTLLLLKYS